MPLSPTSNNYGVLPIEPTLYFYDEHRVIFAALAGPSFSSCRLSGGLVLGRAPCPPVTRGKIAWFGGVKYVSGISTRLPTMTEY